MYIMQSKNLPCFRSLLCSTRFGQNFLRTPAIIRNAASAFGSSNGYYIMAPDMPSDTEENNPALRIPQKGDAPKYSQMTNRQCYRAFIKRALMMESCMDDIEIEETEQDFETVIKEIESNLVPLQYSFATIDHLNAVSHKKFNFPNIETIRQSYIVARSRKSNSRQLYECMKIVDLNRDSLSKIQSRIVDKLLLEGRLNGGHIGPNEMEGLQYAIRKLTEEGNKFNKNVTEANKHFADFLSGPAIIGSLPENLFGNQKIRDIDPAAAYKPILEGSTDRNARKQFWLEYNTRALKRNQQQSNSVVIERIREARKEQAKMIGHDNYAELSMTTKMAGSVENVRSFLNTIHSKTSDSIEKSVETLTDYAKQRSKGSVTKLEMWDVDHYRKDYIRNEINLDDEAVQQYFPFPKVLQGMFNLALRLFQVHVEEAKKGTFDSWHEDVRLFNLVSPAGVCGSFYLDPYQRKEDKMIGTESSARVDFLLPRSSILSTHPLTCLTLNHCKPILTGEHLKLNFHDVRNLFQLFGSILQFSLTEIPYSEINGFNFIEMDACKITPQFLDLWLLHDYKTISDCSSHVKTKEPLPQELHDKLIKANYKFSCLALNQEVYKSALDLALYSNTEFWGDIVGEVWKMYLEPFDRHPDEAQLCSFTDIMTGAYPAAYYSPLWSQMLAAEVFGSFEKVMGDEKKVEELGLRFRDTFLGMGGGVATSDSFHNFVGQRNPVPDHLIRLHTQD